MCMPDAHVGKHIFDQCIRGQLKDKTRLLVTNQNYLLPFATSIVVVSHGRIVQQGTYDALVAAGVDFAALIEENAGPRAASPGVEPAVVDGEEPEVATPSTSALLGPTDHRDGKAGEAASVRQIDAVATDRSRPVRAPADQRLHAACCATYVCTTPPLDA